MVMLGLLTKQPRTAGPPCGSEMTSMKPIDQDSSPDDESDAKAEATPSWEAFGRTHELPLLVTVPRVLAELNIGKVTLYKYLHKPLPLGLPTVRLGACVRVHRDDLEAFVTAHRLPARGA